MRVLIADFDLFRTVGGGQTFYRSVIEKNPRIEFSYLIDTETPDAPRPANAHPIRYQREYLERHWTHDCDILPPRWCLPAFLLASNIALSVRGLEFDVVDFPDYQRFGYFLPAALAHHGARVKHFALSMHGVISATLSMNWGREGPPPHTLVVEEEMQYQSADTRYGLSRAYLDQWQARFSLPSHFLSPLRFAAPPQARRSPPGGPPDLAFIGRTEKCKGPDLFAELVWWLPAQAYGRARIIGPSSESPPGVSSREHLARLLRNRPMARPIELCPAASSGQLAEIFAGRTVTILPSRFDTLNLIALESLFAGCPTAIGSGAGACRFLDETFPGIPYVKIDLDSPLACLPHLEALLTDYDCHRDRLVDSLAAARPEIAGPSLEEIYLAPAAHEQEVRQEARVWYERLMAHFNQSQTGLHPALESARRFVRRHTTPELRQRLRKLRPMRVAAAGLRAARRGSLRLPPLRRRAERRAAAARAEWFATRYLGIAWMPERSADDLDQKWLQCSQLIADLRLDRITLWRELARLETMRGNDLVAATYRLRAMRLAGLDRYHDLPQVKATLEANGYQREAVVADAIYGDHADAERRCRELLERALDDHRQLPVAQFERLDDRREPRIYRVSVIVSLYQAADKLPRFLDALAQQTLLKRGEAEIVLVDSGSPADEYRAFRRWTQDNGLPVVYARSANRETIQSAWNRGIGLARGRYLCFLGVDETMVPRALEQLAAELDAEPTLDWVVSGGLVTNVDARGLWTGDVMTYDRSGYHQRLVSLESCYLTYVGGMYRRDLHQRVGYYDASFSAAGDTEFKNRALPFLRSKAVADTLGVFWNYPDGQTTSSPRAEIEDLRALYLHRTPAGIDYVLQNADRGEAESLLLSALQYRKSYCQHASSDVEYAARVARHISHRWKSHQQTRFNEGIEGLLRAYRELDDLPQVSAAVLGRALEDVRRVEREVVESQRSASDRFQPVYDVFRDNRHEQHANLWPTVRSSEASRQLSIARRAA